MKFLTVETIYGQRNIETFDFLGVEVPKKLYKYRDWLDIHHRKTINHNQIYLCKASDFNDPFDCRIDVAYHLLKTDPVLREAYFLDVVKRLFPSKNQNELLIEAERLIQEGRYNDDDYMEKVGRENFAEFNERYGFYCLTPINDNILMWSHYANSHSGICIGFDSKTVFESLYPFGLGIVIEYSNQYPVILPTNNQSIIKIISTKSSIWKYEYEYRLARGISNEKERKIALPENVITEVIFGINFKQENVFKVKKMAKRNNPSVKFFKSRIKPNSFELIIEPLD